MSAADPFARLGASVLSYLESLPLKQQLLTLLALKGQEGFPEDQLLAAEDHPEALRAAADELRSEGRLLRCEHPDGRIFWAYPEHGGEDAGGRRDQARRRPDRANDGGPDTGGFEM